MTNENYKTLLSVLIVMCCVFGCSWYNSYKKDKQLEKKLAVQRQDSLRKAFVADSLATDHSYQDSVRKAKADYLKWKALNDSISDKEIVGFVLLGDSCYHNIFHPLLKRVDGLEHNYSVDDIPNLRYITYKESQINHLTLCQECEEINEVYSSYELGDLVERK